MKTLAVVYLCSGGWMRDEQYCVSHVVCTVATSAMHVTSSLVFTNAKMMMAERVQYEANTCFSH